MSFIDKLLRRKPTPETVPVQDKPVSNVQTLDNQPSNPLDEVLKELKMIYAFLINHDQRLIKHDQVNAEYLTEILLQNKIITPDKKPEVQIIISKAITDGIPKAETVQKLIDIGIPRSTAYTYFKPNMKKAQPDQETQDV